MMKTIGANVSMKMTTAAILALSLVLTGGLSGCSAKQDPLADESESVRNGVPPEKDKAPPSTKPVSSDALRIQSADYVNFKESEEGKIKISGVVLQPVNGKPAELGKDFELVVTNLSDFPGARFDASTGEFTWKPRSGYVDDNYTQNAHIDVTLSTLASPIMSTSRQIPAVVTRGANVPTIVANTLTSGLIREGDKVKFDVLVRDPAAQNKTDMRPRLVILAGRSGSSSIASLVYEDGAFGRSEPTVEPNDPTLYRFRMVLDLAFKDAGGKDIGKEVTRLNETFQFSLQAVSRFGEVSQATTLYANVITNVKDPQVSWPAPAPVDVVIGQDNTINFTVFDPNDESNLRVSFITRCDRLPGGAVCLCNSLVRDGTQLCSVSWKPPGGTAATEFLLELEVFARTKVQNDTYNRNVKFQSLRMRLINPSSTPSPMPNPFPAAAASASGEVN